MHAEEAKNPTLNYNVVIVGGGTAGLAVANQLKRSKDVTMAIVEPSATHYYQPGWTLFAAGFIQWDKIVGVTEKYIPKGSLFLFNSFSPDFSLTHFQARNGSKHPHRLSIQQKIP